MKDSKVISLEYRARATSTGSRFDGTPTEIPGVTSLWNLLDRNIALSFRKRKT